MERAPQARGGVAPAPGRVHGDTVPGTGRGDIPPGEMARQGHGRGATGTGEHRLRRRPDLVQEGGNGFTFDPFDVADPARLLVKISFGEADLKVMDEASRRIIANWTPEVLAQHPFKAVAAARAAKTARNR